MISSPFDSVAVVPIFVNAGTALLPAILAPLASAAALLLRPRELIAACRRRPLVPLVILVVVAGLSWGTVWLFSKPAEHPAASVVTAGDPVQTTDWAQEALRIIGLGPVWEYNPKDGSMFLSSPAVVGDRVYAASCLQDATGNFGAVVCLDALRGQLIWRTNKADGQFFKAFFSSPAISADGKYLLIGQGLHSDADSDLTCLDTTTGKVRWKIRTPLHIESSPAIAGDLVVAGTGAIEEGPEHKPKGNPGFVLAARISDGKELWRCPVADPESSPAIGSDGTVYIGSGFNGNAVVALRSESDEQLKAKGLSRIRWQTPTAYPITNDITLVGNLVIAGGGNSDYVVAADEPAGEVMALDAATGQVRWRVAMPDAVLGRVSVEGDRVICPVRNGEVVAMNLADGKVIWRQRISGDAPILTGPAVAGEWVYVASADGNLATLKLVDGTIVGVKHQLNSKENPGGRGLCLSSPAVAGGRVYIGSETGGVRCFDGKVAP